MNRYGSSQEQTRVIPLQQERVDVICTYMDGLGCPSTVKDLAELFSIPVASTQERLKPFIKKALANVFEYGIPYEESVAPVKAQADFTHQELAMRPAGQSPIFVKTCMPLKFCLVHG